MSRFNYKLMFKPVWSGGNKVHYTFKPYFPKPIAIGSGKMSSLRQYIMHQRMKPTLKKDWFFVKLRLGKCQ